MSRRFLLFIISTSCSPQGKRTYLSWLGAYSD